MSCQGSSKSILLRRLICDSRSSHFLKLFQRKTQKMSDVIQIQTFCFSDIWWKNSNMNEMNYDINSSNCNKTFLHLLPKQWSVSLPLLISYSCTLCCILYPSIHSFHTISIVVAYSYTCIFNIAALFGCHQNCIYRLGIFGNVSISFRENWHSSHLSK